MNTLVERFCGLDVHKDIADVSRAHAGKFRRSARLGLELDSGAQISRSFMHRGASARSTRRRWPRPMPSVKLVDRTRSHLIRFLVPTNKPRESRSGEKKPTAPARPRKSSNKSTTRASEGIRSAAPELSPDKAPEVDPDVIEIFEDLRRMIEAPMFGFLESEDDSDEEDDDSDEEDEFDETFDLDRWGRAADELSHAAAATPAMTRLREIVTFVGKGRGCTKAGNLRAMDATSLAKLLGVDTNINQEIRSMDELPDTAHDYQWALAAEFLEQRGNKVVPGPHASGLDLDPLSTWLIAVTTLLGSGLLGGFRKGWRKNYVELLDMSIPSLLQAILDADGTASIAEIEENAWTMVAENYDYAISDTRERRHVASLVGAMVGELSGLGIAYRDDDDDLILTELGETLAALLAMIADGEPEDVELVDADAEVLLVLCSDEMDPAEATECLREWCDSRSAEEAVDDLCETLLHCKQPRMLELGFEALAMLPPALARPAVQSLQSHPKLGRLATDWLARDHH